jgi:beta-N-acetylhexosaminidase
MTALSGASLLAAFAALMTTLAIEGRFQWTRYQVLHANQSRLETLGRHLIVGYRNLDELRALIERRAIAGVFVAAHNVNDKDANALRGEIAALQAIRRQQGLPPLLIAADQEGGGVSRMSPPLRRPPSLGEIARNNPDADARRHAVRQFARDMGRDLAGLRFNVNFAPVVDLNHSVVNPNDRYTRIYQRAISNDPQVVTDVAREYCLALRETGVQCTLKHFPGLGRVFEDTHLEQASLNTPVATLEQTDWVPFRALMSNASAFTMLAHARLLDVDPQRPASFSPAVISGLLRGAWKYEGVLVTDDFSMAAAYASRGGLASASVSALNAGVDLILIAYDPDLYYPAMYALLQAQSEDRLQSEVLDRSDRRLVGAAGLNAGQAVSAD